MCIPSGVAVDGIWAYHAGYQEMVLVTTSVLAFLGDNPMQSEMACHIGLRGKFFCRMCTVKGRDVDDECDMGVSNAGDAASSQSSSSSSSDNTESKSGKRKRAKETLENLVDRARRFMKVSRVPCT